MHVTWILSLLIDIVEKIIYNSVNLVYNQIIMALSPSSAAGAKKVLFLLDVDGTVLLRDSITACATLNDSLIKFLLQVQRSLEGNSIEVTHQLFTARILLQTWKHAYGNFIAHRRERPGASYEDITLLTNVVKVLREQGLKLDEACPVLQIWDSLRNPKLGTAYKVLHSEHEKGLTKDFPAPSKWLESLDVSCAAYAEGFRGAQQEKLKILVEMVHGGITNHADLKALHGLWVIDGYRTKSLEDERIDPDTKTALLAKRLAQDCDDSALVIWVDDRRDLYDAALSDKTTTVKGRPLAEIMRERVVFIHNDLERPQAQTHQEYMDSLKAQLEGMERHGHVLSCLSGAEALPELDHESGRAADAGIPAAAQSSTAFASRASAGAASFDGATGEIQSYTPSGS